MTEHTTRHCPVPKHFAQPGGGCYRLQTLIKHWASVLKQILRGGKRQLPHISSEREITSDQPGFCK